MVVYAEVEIPADGFVIGRAFSTLPGVRVELERIVPTKNAVVPFIWVRGADPDAVVRATTTHEAVEQIALLDQYEGEGALFRVVWRRSFRDALVAIADSGMALLSGTGTADEWRFELRTMDTEPLSALQERLRRDGVPFKLVRLADVGEAQMRNGYGLTDPQREAILLAYERGYFDEPHGTTLDALAGDIGISRQSFGGRLRRGMHNLVANTLVNYVEPRAEDRPDP